MQHPETMSGRVVRNADGTARALLLPGGEHFEIHAGEDILTAALRSRVRVAYGCRHGNCGTCKHILLEGDVAERGVSPYGLSSADRENGAILLCSSYAIGDLVIERPGCDDCADDDLPVIPPQEVWGRVTDMAPVAGCLSELHLRLSGPLAFRPGQYVELQCPGMAEFRSLSIASPPDRPTELRFVICRQRGGAFSRSLERLKANEQVLLLRGPFGRVCYEHHARPVAIVALDAGIGPALSILADMASISVSDPIALFVAASGSELPYEEELLDRRRSLPQLEIFSCTLGDGPGCGPTPSLVALTQLIGRSLRDPSDRDAYVFGPPALCDHVATLLIAKGLPEFRIKIERFYPASPV